MKIFLLAIIAVILVFVIITKYNNPLKPKQPHTPTPTVVHEIVKPELTAWIAAWDDDKTEEALPPIIDKFTVYSPMLYRVMKDSSLGRHNISNWDTVVAIGRDAGKPIAPVITDESDADRIQKLLYNRSIQQKFISELVTEAKNEDYSGWSIDIEKLTSKDRNAFSNFVIAMSKELHKNNLKLYMIAYGRDADETYDPALAHDYKVFGQYADQVQLMTYGYSNAYTEPGGETPLDWYRSALQYAIDNIPTEKIVVGLGTNGNVWEEGSKEIEAVTYQEAQDRLEEHDVESSYDEPESAMKATYEEDGNEYTMYYENAETLTDKMKIAEKEFGINKFAFWRLGIEDPELWNALDSEDFFSE